MGCLPRAEEAFRELRLEADLWIANERTTVEQVNYLAGHKSMAMTKRYDHANEERYGGAIEALDEAGNMGKAEALAAVRWKQT